MTKKLKLFISAFIFALMLVCLALFAVGCSGNKGNGGNGSGNKNEQYLPKSSAVASGHGGVVCSADGFEKAKKDWYNIEPFELLSEKAKSAVVSDIVVDEKYYVVYTANLPYSELNKYVSSTRGNTCDYKLYVNFNLCATGNVSANYDPSDYELISYDKDGKVSNVRYTAPNSSSRSTVYFSAEAGKGIKTYFVISIIPRREGELKISCGFEQGSKSNYHNFYCNVNSRQTLNSGMHVKLDNLTTFFEKTSDYPGGELPEDYKPVKQSSLRLSMEESYYNFIRFDITPLGDYPNGKVYCAVTLAGTNVGFSVDSSSTGDYRKANGTDFFGFSISDGANSKKTVTACFTVVPKSDGNSSVHVSVFGAGVFVSGINRTDETITTYKATYDQDIMEKDGFLTYISQSNSYYVRSVTDKNIKEAVVPDTFNGKPVTGIAEGAFKDAKLLTKVTIGDNVEVIGKNAFSECTSLTTVTINGGDSKLEEIGDYAFYKCTSLTSPQIPAQIKKIGSYAFYGCEKIEEIVLPAQLETIGACAFMQTALTKIHIPARVKTIGAGAFSNCLGVYDRDYYGNATRWCSLESITVSASNNNFVVHEGALYNSDKTIIKLFPMGSSIKTCNIPDVVEEIEAYAFYAEGSTQSNVYMTELQKISVPESVTKIGEFGLYVNVFRSSSYNVTIAGDSAWQLKQYNGYNRATISASDTKPYDVLEDTLFKYREYIWTKET